MTNTSLKKECTITYDSTLNHLLDGFVGQLICVATGATKVYKEIGKPDELIYHGENDMEEMQTQMYVDHHMQLLSEGMKRYMLEHIKRHKIYPGGENRIKLIK